MKLLKFIVIYTTHLYTKIYCFSLSEQKINKRKMNYFWMGTLIEKETQIIQE